MAIFGAGAISSNCCAVRAREAVGLHGLLHDDMLDDACNSSTEPGAVARDRLKVDTKKWILSKMLLTAYGDKIAQEITGKDGEPFYKKHVGGRAAAMGVLRRNGSPLTPRRTAVCSPLRGSGGAGLAQ
jgi:hypothetical protein